MKQTEGERKIPSLTEMVEHDINEREAREKVRDAAPDLLEALEFHNQKPLHPNHPSSEYKEPKFYNKDYKIWAKKFDKLKKKAIEKVAK